jgi:HSP20 family protein
MGSSNPWTAGQQPPPFFPYRNGAGADERSGSKSEPEWRVILAPVVKIEALPGNIRQTSITLKLHDNFLSFHLEIRQLRTIYIDGTGSELSGRTCVKPNSRRREVMNMRSLIPWSRQEDRLPAMMRDNDTSPIRSFRREIDRMFDDAFRSFGNGSNLDRTFNWPSIELSEKDNEVKLVAEIPGLSEDDIDLTVNDGVLTLKGERRNEEERQDGYSECFYGRFERHIALPQGAEEDKAKAEFNNGMLTVTIPYSGEGTMGHKIPINTGSRH